MGSPDRRPRDEAVVGPALTADVLRSIDDLGEDCLLELESLTGLAPREALLALHAGSDRSTVATLGGRTLFVAGAVPVGGDSADVWLFPAQDLLNRPLLFANLVRAELHEASDHYGILHGYADEHNDQRVRWLRALGFTFLHALIGYGPRRRTVYEYIGSF